MKDKDKPKKASVEDLVAILLPRLNNLAAEIAALAIDLEGMAGDVVASGNGNTDPGGGGG